MFYFVFCLLLLFITLFHSTTFTYIKISNSILFAKKINNYYPQKYQKYGKKAGDDSRGTKNSTNKGEYSYIPWVGEFILMIPVFIIGEYLTGNGFSFAIILLLVFVLIYVILGIKKYKDG